MQQNSDHHRLKFIAGADAFGSALKDTLVSHLRSLNIEVEDIGTDSYYTIGEKIGRTVSSATTTTTTTTVRGLVACGTGVGVSIFANKFPGVYAATCLTPSDAINARSINNCNVIAFSGMSSSPESAIETLDNFLNTPFKSPCPASNNKPWPDNIQSFFDESLTKMSKIGSDVQISSNSSQISSNSSQISSNSSQISSNSCQISSNSSQNSSNSCQISSNSGPISSNLTSISSNSSSISSNSCSICNLAGGREFAPVEIMPGGSMVIVRESPTSAVVRFAGGSVEPAHHHKHGHDVVVMKGRKIVWNLSKGERVELVAGDYLFTPAGDVHRVKYLEDTEFFIRWDGDWDIELDEDLATATANLENEGE